MTQPRIINVVDICSRFNGAVQMPMHGKSSPKYQMLGANPKDFLVGVDQFELLKTCTFLVKRITK
jgi:hypothetical protein